MKRSQLAINSVSTRHKDLEEAVSAYAAAGFPSVEFCLPHVTEWMKAGHTLDDVKKLLSKHKIACIGGFVHGVESFSEPDAMRTNHDSILQHAHLIHDLGGTTMVVGTDGPPTPSVEALDTVAATFKKLIKRMEGMNVTLAIEFNWSPLIKSLTAAAVARKVDHPNVGVLFDPAHYYVTSTKFEDLNADNVRWIKHVHMNDMRDKPGELSNCNADRVLPGQGVLDLKAILGAIDRHGYKGFYSIEMFSDELWNLPAAETSKRCFQSLLPLCQG